MSQPKKQFQHCLHLKSPEHKQAAGGEEASVCRGSRGPESDYPPPEVGVGREAPPPGTPLMACGGFSQVYSIGKAFLIIAQNFC